MSLLVVQLLTPCGSWPRIMTVFSALALYSSLGLSAEFFTFYIIFIHTFSHNTLSFMSAEFLLVQRHGDRILSVKINLQVDLPPAYSKCIEHTMLQLWS